MQWLINLGVLVVAYLIGSIPFGLIIVRIKTGQDIRKIESGRTGGTNVMRAAGFGAGLFTAILDVLKSAVAVVIARNVVPGQVWIEVLAPVAAILGHNYPIFLVRRDASGQLHVKGGAGGASCVGGSFGLWWPSIFITVPLGAIVLYFIGYASLATLSVAVTSALIFLYRAWIGASPWEYIFYGIITSLVLAYGLRPNIRRLLDGTERMIGLRAQRRRKRSNSEK